MERERRDERRWREKGGQKKVNDTEERGRRKRRERR